MCTLWGPLTMLDSALEFVEAGFPVIPLWGLRADGACQCPDPSCTGSSRGKHPHSRLVPRGLKEASDDPDVVRAWWSRAPTANVGVVTGGHFFVIDVDAAAAWQQVLEDEGEDEPDTATSTTGKGYHLWFAKDDQIVVRNQQSLLVNGERVKGIDVRGEGGYVVAPPSHHYLGGVYAWRRPLELLAAAPPWLLALVAGETDLPQPAPEPAPARASSAPPSSPPASPDASAPSTERAPAPVPAADSSMDPKILAWVREALEVVPPNPDRQTWVELISMPLHDVFKGSDLGFEVWHAWCRRAAGLHTPNGNPAYGGEAECRKVWRSF